MPQLDIVYIFMVYLWAWFTLIMITQKIKTFTLTTEPNNQTPMTPKQTNPLLPWT